MLLLGKEISAGQTKSCNSKLLLGEVEVIHSSKTAEVMDERIVSLYDITAASNLQTLFANKHQYVVGRIQIPSIPVCDGAVYISGDGMYPILKSGDIVGFKEIRSFSSAIYGEMYMVSFNKDGDEYLGVKYVNRSDVEGCIRLVSYNSHHEPMDVPFECIQAMAIVKFSIRKNMMM